jgi:hypothetical protein
MLFYMQGNSNRRFLINVLNAMSSFFHHCTVSKRLKLVTWKTFVMSGWNVLEFRHR